MTSELKPCLPSKNSDKITHGHTIGKTYSPTYSSWQSMLSRCRYPERDIENKYSGRGISVCEQWNEFENFLHDMGERPTGTTLDRVDVNKGYEPSNCRWATPIQQARNRRNKRLTFSSAVEIALARFRGEDCKSIAVRFGISESLPREIEKGRTWVDASKLARTIFRKDYANG